MLDQSNCWSHFNDRIDLNGMFDQFPWTDAHSNAIECHASLCVLQTKQVSRLNAILCSRIWFLQSYLIILWEFDSMNFSLSLDSWWIDCLIIQTMQFSNTVFFFVFFIFILHFVFRYCVRFRFVSFRFANDMADLFHAICWYLEFHIEYLIEIAYSCSCNIVLLRALCCMRCGLSMRCVFLCFRFVYVLRIHTLITFNHIHTYWAGQFTWTADSFMDSNFISLYRVWKQLVGKDIYTQHALCIVRCVGMSLQKKKRKLATEKDQRSKQSIRNS